MDNKLSQVNGDLEQQMLALGHQAKEAARVLACSPSESKNLALKVMAQDIIDQEKEILGANEKDIESAIKVQKNEAFLDRLKLDKSRLEGIAKGLEAIADLRDPVGEIIAEWDRPNGLKIQRKRVPLGVIGIIYESRPNVTADAGGLCIKSGNAAILRGGSDSFNSSMVIQRSLHKGLESQGIPKSAIQIVPTTDRDAVGMMLTGLGGTIDVIVPRGGKSLVERVQNDARVPVFSHLEGLCHVYVDGSANLQMAIDVVVNAKMRRTGICGAAETLLIDKSCLDTHAEPIISALIDAGCEVRGDQAVQEVYPSAVNVVEQDWLTEYLDSIISVRAVDGIKGAIQHINQYSSQHTDCIISDDVEVANIFLEIVDSAIVLHNASTQFADGGEFGMGAEIGIATGKMHARGPVGVEQLTSFKYVVRGTGQIRG